MTKKLLTLENIRSGDVPSDAVAVGFLLGEIEKLQKDGKCLVAGCTKPTLRAAMCEEHNAPYTPSAIPRSALEPGACAVVNEQAEDEGLWFQPVYASEAYLQAALRRLHAAVEGASRDMLIESVSRSSVLTRYDCSSMHDTAVNESNLSA